MIETTLSRGILKCFFLSILMFGFAFTAQAQTVTKTYTAPSSISVDGNGTYAFTLPSVNFAAADFTPGNTIVSDVNVQISWAKTDGSCTAPGTGNSFHNETNFRANGPTGNQVILVQPGTYTGGGTISTVSTTFDQAAATVVGGVNPTSGTFRPNNGNLNTYNGLAALGNYSISAGDTAGGDPLCITGYSITVTAVADTTPPVITCPADDTIECDASTAPANTGTATATDNSGLAPTITFSDVDVPVSGNNYVKIRTWTATDTAGNSSMCDQIITVTDTMAPAITCPADITIECNTDQSPAATGTATAVDNCEAMPTISFTDAFMPGTGNNAVIVRTWTATDANGNSSTCDQTITISDTTGPVITCPADLTIECNTDDTPATTGSATAVDNCDMMPVITFSDSVVAGTGSNSVITRTWTATDANMNASMCVQTITVVDTTAPVITCPADVTIECNTDDTPATTGSATAVDNCDTMPVITFSDAVVAGTGSNSVITRTWTATDANMNASMCVQTITVVDTTAPVITCPADVTIECNTDSSPTATGSATAVDNCDTMPVITFADVVVAGTGQNSVITRTWTATDANMNASTCVQTITVVDTTAPVAMCAAPFTVQLDAVGMASITAADVDNGSTDNCGMITTTIDIMDFDCDDIGTPVTVTMTVTDENMNSSTCTTTVTVEDNIPVTVISGPIDIFTGTGDFDDDCATVVDYGTITIADFVVDNNCGDDSSLTVTFTGGLGSGANFPVGINAEEYTITDSSGNETIYTFNVTITDTTDPAIDCPDDLTVSDGGTGSYTILDYTGLFSDNCTVFGDLVITQDPVAGTEVDALTTTTVTLTATDEAGNETTCEFDILVDGSLGVDDNAIDARDINVYPNPTTGTLQLATTNVVIETVEVYDLRGRLVLSRTFNVENPSLDLTDFEAATYILRITTERGTLTKRIIKM